MNQWESYLLLSGAVSKYDPCCLEADYVKKGNTDRLHSGDGQDSQEAFLPGENLTPMFSWCDVAK